MFRVAAGFAVALGGNPSDCGANIHDQRVHWNVQFNDGSLEPRYRAAPRRGFGPKARAIPGAAALHPGSAGRRGGTR